jgi:hypothetical protein
MATKHDLHDWVQEAIRANSGSATLVEVAKYIWRNHESELRASGDLFFTWQYDMRWAANGLRKKGIMRSVAVSPSGVWQLT